MSVNDRDRFGRETAVRTQNEIHSKWGKEKGKEAWKLSDAWSR